MVVLIGLPDNMLLAGDTDWVVMEVLGARVFSCEGYVSGAKEDPPTEASILNIIELQCYIFQYWKGYGHCFNSSIFYIFRKSTMTQHFNNSFYYIIIEII